MTFKVQLALSILYFLSNRTRAVRGLARIDKFALLNRWLFPRTILSNGLAYESAPIRSQHFHARPHHSTHPSEWTWNIENKYSAISTAIYKINDDDVDDNDEKIWQHSFTLLAVNIPRLPLQRPAIFIAQQSEYDTTGRNFKELRLGRLRRC